MEILHNPHNNPHHRHHHVRSGPHLLMLVVRLNSDTPVVETSVPGEMCNNNSCFHLYLKDLSKNIYIFFCKCIFFIIFLKKLESFVIKCEYFIMPETFETILKIF